MEMTLDQKRAVALAAARKRAQQARNTPQASGDFLPLSRMPNGDVKFDSNAGIIGGIKRSISLPGEVMRGDVPVRGADGNLTDEVLSRTNEMAAYTAPMNPLVRSGDKAIPGLVRNIQRKPIKTPTTQQLFDEGARGFETMRATGVEYPLSAVQDMARSAKIGLDRQGLRPNIAKKTHQTLDDLISAPEGAIADIDGLHAARQTFGKIGGMFNKPQDQRAALTAKSGLDDFIRGQAAGPDSATATAARALETANGNYAAANRSKLIGSMQTKAERKAAAANSGQNIGNAIRSRVASALDQPKQTAGFSPDEIKALEGVNFGSPAANATRDLGNSLGGSGGLAPTVGAGVGATLGYQVGAPGYGAMIGAGIPAVGGRALKGMSNKLTEKALRHADDMIRKRSPLYESLLRKSPLEAKGPTKSSALVKELLRQKMMIEQGIDPRSQIVGPNSA